MSAVMNGEITKKQLQIALGIAGFAASARWIKFSIYEGLLPQLECRGSGRGRGKVYYWSNSESLIGQAVAIRSLREKGFSNDRIALSLWLLGFRIDLGRAKEGWKAFFDGIGRWERRKVARAERRRGSFSHISDRASYLSGAMASKVSSELKFNNQEVRDLIIGLFPLISIEGRPSIGSAATLDLFSILEGRSSEFPQDGIVLLRSAFGAAAKDRLVRLLSNSETDDLLVARDLMQQLVALVGEIIPQLREVQDHLTTIDWIIVRLGPFLLGLFVELVRNGRASDTAFTIEKVSEFVRGRALPPPQFLGSVRSDPKFAAQVADLLGTLADLWNVKGFPFVHAGAPTPIPSVFSPASCLRGILSSY